MDGPMVHWWYKCDVVGLVGMFSNSHVSGQNVIFVHTIVGASLLMKWHLSDDEGLFWVCETVQSGEWGEVSFSEQGGGTKWPKFYTLGNETLTQENRCPYIPTPPGPPPIFHPQIKVRRVLIWKNHKNLVTLGAHVSLCCQSPGWQGIFQNDYTAFAIGMTERMKKKVVMSSQTWFIFYLAN